MKKKKLEALTRRNSKAPGDDRLRMIKLARRPEAAPKMPREAARGAVGERKRERKRREKVRVSADLERDPENEKEREKTQKEKKTH